MQTHIFRVTIDCIWQSSCCLFFWLGKTYVPESIWTYLMFITDKKQFKNINWQQMLPEKNLLALQYSSPSVQISCIKFHLFCLDFNGKKNPKHILYATEKTQPICKTQEKGCYIHNYTFCCALQLINTALAITSLNINNLSFATGKYSRLEKRLLWSVN